MPTYRYQAATATGVSVFGVFEAPNEEGLASILAARNLRLVSASELSVFAAAGTHPEILPRMMQLRVGERLREALLTDIPVHDAMRAIAAEPIEHPLLMMMPVLFGLSCVTGIVILAVAAAFPGFAGIPGGTVLPVSGIIAGIGVLWGVLHYLLVTRLRKTLRRISDRLEMGDESELSRFGVLPSELRVVAGGRMTTTSRALSIAELVPVLSGMELRKHILATRLLAGPLALTFLCSALYVLMLVVVPKFHQIYTEFSVQLSSFTLVTLEFSRLAVKLGWSGLFALLLTSAIVLVSAYVLLVWNRTLDFWEAIPGVGISIRWLMQVRVARVLGVLIRNRTETAEAVETATEASGYSSLRDFGRIYASSVREGKAAPLWSRQLSGLPLAMLHRIDQQDASDEARQETAQAFQIYADAVEQAAEGNDLFLTIIMETVIMAGAGLTIGYVVLSLFFPIMQLLRFY